MLEKVTFGVVVLVFAAMSIAKARRRRSESALSRRRRNNSSTRDMILAQLNDVSRVEHVLLSQSYAGRLIERTDSLALPIQSALITYEKNLQLPYMWKSILNHVITFNASFLIVGGLSESYFYGVRMIGNIISVCLGMKEVYSNRLTSINRLI